MDAGRKRRQFLQGVAVHVKTTAAIREQMRNADENKSRIFGTIRPYPSTENTSSAKPGNIREQNVTSKVRQRPQMMGPVVALFPTLSSGVAMRKYRNVVIPHSGGVSSRTRRRKGCVTVWVGDLSGHRKYVSKRKRCLIAQSPAYTVGI